jgi:hypothetical protein
MERQTQIACALSAAERPARIAAARELGQRALVALEVDGRRALLRFHGERDRVDHLVAAEGECCAFFEFASTRNADETELEIRAPDGGEPLLRGLVAGIVAGWDEGLR